MISRASVQALFFAEDNSAVPGIGELVLFGVMLTKTGW